MHQKSQTVWSLLRRHQGSVDYEARNILSIFSIFVCKSFAQKPGSLKNLGLGFWFLRHVGRGRYGHLRDMLWANDLFGPSFRSIWAKKRSPNSAYTEQTRDRHFTSESTFGISRNLARAAWIYRFVSPAEGNRRRVSVGRVPRGTVCRSVRPLCPTLRPGRKRPSKTRPKKLTFQKKQNRGWDWTRDLSFWRAVFFPLSQNFWDLFDVADNWAQQAIFGLFFVCGPEQRSAPNFVLD